MQCDLSSLACFGLEHDHHSVVRGRSKTIVEKTHAKKDIVIAAILLAVGRKLHGSAARKQFGTREVADGLHPIPCKVNITHPKTPAMRLVRGLKDDLSRTDEMQCDHGQCGP